MPNHVHLILVPSDPDGLRRALARVHRIYAGVIQARRKRSGHFWQGRFGAVAMDEEHLAAALRYVSLNPVRARLVERAQDWRWSSTRAHWRGKDDGLTALAPIRDRFPRFADLLGTEPEQDLFEPLRAAESIGREHRPAARQRPLSHPHRAADRTHAQTPQARTKAVGTERPPVRGGGCVAWDAREIAVIEIVMDPLFRLARDIDVNPVAITNGKRSRNRRSFQGGFF